MKNKFNKFAITALFSVFGAALTASAIMTPVTSSTVVVTGNAAPWYFNADPANTTPYTFNTNASSIGVGSLYVLPIGLTAADKFTADNLIATPISNVNSISYDFRIGSTGNPSQAGQFYMNVYANFGSSLPTKYYDCRYNVVPVIGSTGGFTTVTFDPTQAYPVDQRVSSPFTCPAVPADMNLLSPGSNIRAFTLNVGDSSAADAGVSGYFDKVVVSTVSNITTYDFEPTPTTSNVHIYKYIDGVQATAENANGVSFPMFTSTYGGSFNLGPNGLIAGDIAYEASTGEKPLGFSYTMNEQTNTTLVGTACDGSHQYALAGYQMSSVSLADAATKPITLTAPSFTNLNGEGYIIVRNIKCTNYVAPTYLKVHILKYLGNSPATAVTANSALFPMVSTWTTANLNGGLTTSGSYVLGNSEGGAVLYGADTSLMQSGASYTTSEVTSLTGNFLPIGAKCSPGKYRLVGYQTSAISFTDAATQTVTPTSPNYTGLTSDRYLIVKNKICPTKNENKDECKKDGWKTFTNPKFKNQGQCVSSFEGNEDGKKDDSRD